MTPEEYKQLKAFARIDGALLSLVWIGSFALYISGMEKPTLSLLSIVLIVVSPFIVARRLRKFRDFAREGIISFKRGYAYVVLIFFYSGLLFAAAQYVYFAYMDHGFLLGMIQELLSAPESEPLRQALGMGETLNESLQLMASMRPIDYSLNILTLNILAGFVVGLPIAALMQKSVNSVNIK